MVVRLCLLRPGEEVPAAAAIGRASPSLRVSELRLMYSLFSRIPDTLTDIAEIMQQSIGAASEEESCWILCI